MAKVQSRDILNIRSHAQKFVRKLKLSLKNPKSTEPIPNAEFYLNILLGKSAKQTRVRKLQPEGAKAKLKLA